MSILAGVVCAFFATANDKMNVVVNLQGHGLLGPQLKHFVSVLWGKSNAPRKALFHLRNRLIRSNGHRRCRFLAF